MNICDVINQTSALCRRVRKMMSTFFRKWIRTRIWLYQCISFKCYCLNLEHKAQIPCTWFFFIFFTLNILTGLSQKMLCYLMTIISNISRTILNCHKKVKPILVISNRWPCHVRSFRWHLGKVLLNVIYCRETWSRIKETDKST